jgi:hypothetical protein
MKYIYLILILTWFSCKEDKQVEKVEKPTSNVSTIELPSISEELVKKLYEETDYIDYIFHDLPISVSMETKADIQTNVGMISTTPVGKIPANCKSIGRKFYNSKGNTLLGADIYFSSDCAFYVFLDGEKKLYANKMTEGGLNFYQKIIQQAAKSPSPKVVDTPAPK